MEYECPRCGSSVHRRPTVLTELGPIGAFLAAALMPMVCIRCGPIPVREFPPDDRLAIRMGWLSMIIGAVVLLVLLGVIGAIVIVAAHR